MATSGSFDFSVDRDDVITEALQLCGVIADGETPSSDQLTSCSRTFNMLVKAWQADGMQLYRKKEYTVSLVAADNTYTLGSGGDISEVPTRIKYAFRRDTSNIDVPLEIISDMEYQSLSNKTTSATPTSVYYEYLGTTANIYVWPTPPSGVTDVLHIIGERPIYDFDAASDDVDIPNYYYLAISYGLALAVSAKYGVDRDTRNDLKELALYYKAEALSYDVEAGTSVEIRPTNRWR